LLNLKVREVYLLNTKEIIMVPLYNRIQILNLKAKEKNFSKELKKLEELYKVSVE